MADGTGTAGKKGQGYGLVQTQSIGGGVVTQGSNLRNYMYLPISLMNVRTLLTGRCNWGNWDNWDNWSFDIKHALEISSLEDLIDKGLPRPAAGDPTYQNWEAQSRYLASWLVRQIDHHAVESYIALPAIPVYADDAFKAIKDIVLGHGHTLAYKTWKQAAMMKRSEFGCIEEFISNYRQAIRRSNDIGCPITYYCAVLHILHELEGELPGWTALVEARLPDDDVNTVNYSDFARVCMEAIEKGNALLRRQLRV